MALIQCRECSREISDEALACPHCGAPKAVKRPKPAGAEVPESYTPVREGGTWGIAPKGDGWVFDRTFPTRWKAKLALGVWLQGGRVSDYFAAARKERTRRQKKAAPKPSQRPMSATAAVWLAGVVLLYYLVQSETVNLDSMLEEYYGVLFIIQSGHVLILLGLNKSGMYHLTWKVSLGLYIAIQLFTYTGAFWAIMGWFYDNADTTLFFWN